MGTSHPGTTGKPDNLAAAVAYFERLASIARTVFGDS